VTSIFHHAASGSDAFQEDPVAMRFSSRPVVKACTQLMALINSLCSMLQTTPFHRERYTRLILSVIIQFYQRCSDCFRDLVAPDERSAVTEDQLALSFQWAQRPEVAACLSALYTATETKDVTRLCRQEAHVELNFLADKSIKKGDLVRSVRNISSLGNLYHSLTWFIGELQNLKQYNDEPMSPAPGSALEPATANTPFTPFIPSIPSASSTTEIKLPLSREMGLRFDALVKTFSQLAELVLYTLRIDVRCRTIHYIGLAMRTGNYVLEGEATEPDPNIIDLNATLTACEEAITATVAPQQRTFIFEGLGLLMESLLITYSRRIRKANAAGVRKINRNILALQQNQRAIADDPRSSNLERAKKYYALYSFTPAKLLASIRSHAEFTFDEYKAILNFQYGVDQSLSEAAAAQTADREYNMHLIDLHALAIDDLMVADP